MGKIQNFQFHSCLLQSPCRHFFPLFKNIYLNIEFTHLTFSSFGVSYKCRLQKCTGWQRGWATYITERRLRIHFIFLEVETYAQEHIVPDIFSFIGGRFVCCSFSGGLSIHLWWRCCQAIRRHLCLEPQLQLSSILGRLRQLRLPMPLCWRLTAKWHLVLQKRVFRRYRLLGGVGNCRYP